MLSYQLYVNIFSAIVELGNDRKHKTATQLSSRTRRQFVEQHIINSTRLRQIPQHLTSHNYVAPREKTQLKCHLG